MKCIRNTITRDEPPLREIIDDPMRRVIGVYLKNNVLLLLLLRGLLIPLYSFFSINPVSCLEHNTEVPDPNGGILRSEKVDKKERHVFSFSNAEATEPVSDHGETREKPLLRTEEEHVLKGKDLYEKLCQKCHDAYSNETTVGPGMRGILKNKVLPSSKKPATAQNILNQLNDPFNRMPSFHFLSDEEKLSIITFLNTL